MTGFRFGIRTLRAHVPSPVALLLGLAVLGPGPSPAARLELSHQKPCNLFAPDVPVHVEATLSGAKGEWRLDAAVTNYHGRQVWTTNLVLGAAAPGPHRVSLAIGTPGCGYYELTVSAAPAAAPAGSARAACSFGVSRLTPRSAAEARAAGSRFGLKVFQIGPPGVWWRRPLQWQLGEALDASALLGLQWTRHSFDQRPVPEEPGMVGTVDLTLRHNMNVVYKIEGIPEQAYDAGRYGPMAEYEKKNKKGWRRCTVPLREPYQAWLRERLAALPADQNVFEMGNEVWNYMSAEEFAEWCRLTVPVVRERRPGAVIGADPGSLEWAKRFIAAGGLEGMNAEYIHPYCFTPLPETRVRAWLRNRNEFLSARAGRPLGIYVTEYGWSTAPADRRKQAVSERVQAQRTTRQSLMLYAEDCKTLIPHWMADREHDPTEREHWFGFFRLNGQPKPVLIAHATAARMIDGSRFVGDLWFGHGIGAMLFERQGIHTLALWTRDEAPGSGTNLPVRVGAASVTVVDIMGAERAAAAQDGSVTVRISGDVTYLVGVSPALAAQATQPTADLNPDRWTRRQTCGSISRLAGDDVPRIDGETEDWANRPAIDLASHGAVSNGTARIWMAADADHLFIACRIAGRQPLRPDGRLELSLGTRPSRQLNLGGWSLYDYTVQFAPTSTTGAASLQIANVLWDAPVKDPVDGDESGIRWQSRMGSDGWAAEIALPLRLLEGFPTASGPHRLSLHAQWREPSLKARWANTAVPASESLQWPYVEWVRPPR